LVDLEACLAKTLLGCSFVVAIVNVALVSDMRCTRLDTTHILMLLTLLATFLGQEVLAKLVPGIAVALVIKVVVVLTVIPELGICVSRTTQHPARVVLLVREARLPPSAYLIFAQWAIFFRMWRHS
jgi:hypothetical protein